MNHEHLGMTTKVQDAAYRKTVGGYLLNVVGARSKNLINKTLFYTYNSLAKDVYWVGLD
jgi:hypothetical protein